MDVYGEERGRLARLATWLQATPAEAAGLVVLLAGAVLATGLLWWQAMARPNPGVPAVDPPPAEAVGYLDDRPAGTDGEDHGGHGEVEQTDGHHAAPPADGPLTVHVTGAVAEPGLVTVPAGARVGDAVQAAGGLAGTADPASLNLARRLEDGEHVHVAAEGEAAPPAPAAGDGATGDAAGSLVDINRATAEQLETLPGIGPALASRIIQHRETHGPFRTPGDLRAVSGIGEKTFQNLADLVTAS